MVRGIFKLVVQGVVGGLIPVEMGEERAGEFRADAQFRGNNKGSVNLGDFGVVFKEVHELGGRPIVE